MTRPGLRRARTRRWFEHQILWPLLDARDRLLGRDPAKPLYETHRPRLHTRAKWAALDRWDRTPLARASARPGGILALLALPVAIAAAVVGVTLGGGGGQPGDVPVAHANDAPARVAVRAPQDSSAAERAGKAAARRERAAVAAARRARAADRRRAAAAARRARARRSARKAPAPASTPAATPVSSPTPSAPRPSAPAAPVRPQAPSRPPSNPPARTPSNDVQFDDAG
jgi:hypothetical protein